MSTPKLHHYVPQFYLRRFLASSGRLWAWERDKDRAFLAAPASIAAEQNFYYLDDFVAAGHDPLELERQLADNEEQTAVVTSQWIEWIRASQPGDSLEVPDVNRETVSLFLALQYLRTAGTRSLLGKIAKITNDGADFSEPELRRLHTFGELWNLAVVNGLADHISSCTWTFGHNKTKKPFLTSDNPIACRKSDNSMWLRVGLDSNENYICYPMTPDIILYCMPTQGKWESVKKYDCCVSPVEFNEGMVRDENTAQVFLATRFVLSCDNDFADARAFAATIGTDQYAPEGQSLDDWQPPVEWLIGFLTAPLVAPPPPELPD